jgi:predicted DNA-binding transcriptional regulator YafY
VTLQEYFMFTAFYKSSRTNSIPVTVTEITAFLKTAGFTADRKTIYKDIEALKAFGVDIICIKSTQNRYFVGSRDFELPELALLVDAVQAAKFISLKHSQSLIKKLSKLTSIHQSDKLNRRLYVEKQVKSVNEKVLYTVDLLHTAINDKLKIEFQYIEYSVHKRKLPKHKGKVYSFSPYVLLWNNDNYYALGYSDSHGKIITFRVDRVMKAVLTQNKAVPKPKGFRTDEYIQTVFQMYGGEVQTVTLRCENELMKSVIDKFGEKVKTGVDGNGHFHAMVDVAVSNTFFGWIVGFGGRMEIADPPNVRKQYTDILCSIIKKSHE